MGAAEFKLTAPIKRGEDTIEVLELREPTAKDIKVLGFPITGEKRGGYAVQLYRAAGGYSSVYCGSDFGF